MRTAISLLVLSLVAAVYCNPCQHGDTSQCNLTCNDPTQTLGCEHDICTCVPAGSLGTGCTDMADCSNTKCDGHGHGPGHHGDPHCIDGTCQCLENK